MCYRLAYLPIALLLSYYLLIVMPTALRMPQNRRSWRPCVVRDFGGKVAGAFARCHFYSWYASGSQRAELRRWWFPVGRGVRVCIRHAPLARAFARVSFAVFVGE